MATNRSSPGSGSSEARVRRATCTCMGINGLRVRRWGPPGLHTRARTPQRRTAVVAADLTPAEQVALDQAEEHVRLPKAEERDQEDVSGVCGLSPDGIGREGDR